MSELNTYAEFEEREGVSITDLFYKYLSYWPYFLLLLILSVIGARIYLRYKLPIYLTTASILIKDNQNSAPGQEILQAFDLFGSKKNVENEVEVLQSKTLIQEVVGNLNLYAPVTIEGRLLNQSAYTYSPIIVEARYPDSLHDVTKIPFTFDPVSQSVHVQNQSYPLNDWINTPFGILRFISNKYFPINGKINQDDHFFFSLTTPKKAANSVLSAIKIVPSSQQSTVIDLSIEGEVPKRGEDILNELLTVYNHAAIQDKNVLAANTLKFVQDRLKFVVNELDSVEGRLQKYKSNNKIIDVSAQGQIFLQTVADNDAKLSDANMKLAVLDEIENYVNGKDTGTGPIVPATLGIDDPTLSDLVQKLSDLELQYTQTKKIVPEKNPLLISVVDGINKIKPLLLENLANQRKNLLAARNDLITTSARYNSMLQAIPEKERELLSISRQQVIKNNIYTFLLQKREETALSFASAVADSRIIDEAQSSDVPVSPKKKLIYMGAVLGALVLGFATIFIKDTLTRTVQQRDDFEKYFNTPFLGEVNFEKTSSPIVVKEGRRSYVAEQFRQLRTSLGYMGIEESHKVIMVTSSISGEGKSFIAINLGISLALKEQKVVLLELDLRKPKLSELLGVPRNVGISMFLIGKMAADQIVKPTQQDNLYIIPSGPVPPNPSELISNGRLKELLEILSRQYDYILIDTPPVTPVTDAYLISPYADISLFIIRYGYTPKMILQRLAAQQRVSNLKNPAIIFNGIKGKGFSKYGYNYAYSYGYTEEGNKNIWWKLFKNIRRK